jgi:hypothetical protein
MNLSNRYPGEGKVEAHLLPVYGPEGMTASRVDKTFLYVKLSLCWNLTIVEWSPSTIKDLSTSSGRRKTADAASTAT